MFRIQGGAYFQTNLKLLAHKYAEYHLGHNSIRFLFFGSKLELPWDCGTIQNHAKTLPCARSLSFKTEQFEILLLKLINNS